MKRTFLNLSVFLIVFVVGTIAVSTANAQPQERHPMIRRAIQALENAKVDLQDASHDYCGHREDALESVNNAISQLRQALESDRAEIMPRKDEPSSVMFMNASFEKSILEPHPKIRQAIRSLENARNELQRAARDFGGHRTEAVEATNNAISRLKAAIACDKN